MNSVVLCVYNEEKNIEECLESLKNQTYKNFELIVVDDGSTDNTIEIVKNYENDFDMTIFERDHRGLRNARHFGVSKVQGEIIITVDADEIFDEKFIENIINHFDDEHVGIVGGYIQSYGNNWIAKGLDSLRGLFYKRRDWASGGTMAFRKKFRDLLSKGEVGEDVDLSWQIEEQGYIVKIDNDAVAYHKDPKTVRGVMKKEYKIGKRSRKTFFSHGKYFDMSFWLRFVPLVLLLLIILSWKITLILFFVHMLSVVLSLNSYRLYGFIVLILINIGWSVGVLVSLFTR